MHPLGLVIIFIPIAAILLYPIAAFVMLARFYQRSTRHMLQCMLETVAATQQVQVENKKSRPKGHKKKKPY